MPLFSFAVRQICYSPPALHHSGGRGRRHDPGQHVSQSLVGRPKSLGENPHDLEREVGCLAYQKQELLLDTGTSSTSVAAIAVALRGSLSISAISPKI